MLQVRDLQKAYASSQGMLPVLKGASFSVQPGEFVAIIGESGSGKSTLLQLIGTLDRADAGQVRINDHDILSLSDDAQASVRNRSLGFVYQAHHLIPELSALENVMLPLLVGGMGYQQAAERAAQLLARLRLSDRMEHTPGKLSGGEAQRVAVARALANHPHVLLADEPTGNLDESTASEVFAAFRELSQEEGAAVVMVTHSLALASACDRVLRLHQGLIHPA